MVTDIFFRCGKYKNETSSRKNSIFVKKNRKSLNLHCHVFIRASAVPDHLLLSLKCRNFFVVKKEPRIGSLYFFISSRRISTILHSC